MCEQRGNRRLRSLNESYFTVSRDYDREKSREENREVINGRRGLPEMFMHPRLCKSSTKREGGGPGNVIFIVDHLSHNTLPTIAT